MKAILDQLLDETLQRHETLWHLYTDFSEQLKNISEEDNALLQEKHGDLVKLNTHVLLSVHPQNDFVRNILRALEPEEARDAAAEARPYEAMNIHNEGLSSIKEHGKAFLKENALDPDTINPETWLDTFETCVQDIKKYTTENLNENSDLNPDVINNYLEFLLEEEKIQFQTYARHIPPAIALLQCWKLSDKPEVDGEVSLDKNNVLEVVQESATAYQDSQIKFFVGKDYSCHPGSEERLLNMIGVFSATTLEAENLPYPILVRNYTRESLTFLSNIDPVSLKTSVVAPNQDLSYFAILKGMEYAKNTPMKEDETEEAYRQKATDHVMQEIDTLLGPLNTGWLLFSPFEKTIEASKSKIKENLEYVLDLDVAPDEEIEILMQGQPNITLEFIEQKIQGSIDSLQSSYRQLFEACRRENETPFVTSDQDIDVILSLEDPNQVLGGPWDFETSLFKQLFDTASWPQVVTLYKKIGAPAFEHKLTTPLHTLAEKGDIEAMKSYIESIKGHPEFMSIQDEEVSMTPLHLTLGLAEESPKTVIELFKLYDEAGLLNTEVLECEIAGPNYSVFHGLLLQDNEGITNLCLEYIKKFPPASNGYLKPFIELSEDEDEYEYEYIIDFIKKFIENDFITSEHLGADLKLAAKNKDILNIFLESDKITPELIAKSGVLINAAESTEAFDLIYKSEKFTQDAFDQTIENGFFYDAIENVFHYYKEVSENLKKIFQSDRLTSEHLKNIPLEKNPIFLLAKNPRNRDLMMALFESKAVTKELIAHLCTGEGSREHSEILSKPEVLIALLEKGLFSVDIFEPNEKRLYYKNLLNSPPDVLKNLIEKDLLPEDILITFLNSEKFFKSEDLLKVFLNSSSITESILEKTPALKRAYALNNGSLQKLLDSPHTTEKVLKSSDPRSGTIFDFMGKKVLGDGYKTLINHNKITSELLLNTKGKDGELPLSILAKSEISSEPLQYWLEHDKITAEHLKAQNPKDGQTPLHAAVMAKNLEAVRAILDSGKMTKEILLAENHEHKTPRQAAISFYSLERVENDILKALESAEHDFGIDTSQRSSIRP